MIISVDHTGQSGGGGYHFRRQLSMNFNKQPRKSLVYTKPHLNDGHQRVSQGLVFWGSPFFCGFEDLYAKLRLADGANLKLPLKASPMRFQAILAWFGVVSGFFQPSLPS